MTSPKSPHRVPISRGVTDRVIQITKPEAPEPEVPPVFTEMQRNMEDELERRRKDWEREVERMQHDFFKIKTPSSNLQLSDEEFDNVSRNVAVNLGSSPRSPSMGIIQMNDARTNVVDRSDGSRMYRLRFDVSGFDPNEVKVKAEGKKLFVSAWQEVDHGNGHKSSKQFNRQIDIPDHVDPDELIATVSNDGYLNIEGVLEERKSSPLTSLTPEPLVSPPHYYAVVNSKRSPPRSPIIAHSPRLASGSPYLVTGSPVPSRDRYSSSGITSGGSGSPYVVSVNDVRKLKMAVEIGPEFDASDITVKVVGTKIQVHARHEETVAGRTSKREFSREFDLPERLEETTVQAALSPSGRLVIGASVTSNRAHNEAQDSVHRDMPPEGLPVRVVII